MRKRKQYIGTIGAAGISRILDSVLSDGWKNNKPSSRLWLANSEESWSLDDIDVFIEKYSSGSYSSCTVETEISKNSSIEIQIISGEINISISANSALEIERIFVIIDNILTEKLVNNTEKSMHISKKYYFRGEVFSWSVVQKAINEFKDLCKNNEYYLSIGKLFFIGESISVDNIDLFSDKYDIEKMVRFYFTIVDRAGRKEFSLGMYDNMTTVEIKSDSERDIARIVNIFRNCSNSDRYNIAPKDMKKPLIFIGHGRNPQWEKLKSHLQDKHAVDVIAYETGNRAGHTIRDILESMSLDASMALLVLTGEDRTDEGLRARQNVVHECGLFQGKLGFDRAILLVENGVELASNFDGIQQLRFKRSRISETFGDVIATIRREFGPV